MREVTLAVNLNIAPCWLKLGQIELAKHQWDLVMKFDLFNVKSRFSRAQAFLNIGIKVDARSDLLIAIRFDPNNEELRKELRKVAEMNQKKEDKAIYDNSSEGFRQGNGKIASDPLKLDVLPKNASSSTSEATKRHGVLAIGEKNTRKCPFKGLHLSEATYIRMEEGNNVKFFDKHTMAYIVVRIHHNDYQNEIKNAMCEVDHEHHTINVF
ncbi:hypothetical protein Cgig2_026120 [Carnegiea gigantea]|uniref:Uncharacterized protein n=1 Tax=Carnegiea gigantea TaxID=171969 RepID=A0A9Q1GWX2_9CARY|nr:hypothetical protein Cgig2_026120 [Carnegiea gigantea]